MVILSSFSLNCVMPMPCPRHGLTLAHPSSRCHVPNMVLH
ncbi:hypothetical protein F383_28817 [Gossypium arboreum]|uniref:Uncharacterized protein n=1 Tax=Gossypium arboreum TaxID=29729 RepID=A0A0B0MW81_GOSAR|nr:hypothetical protein F383_28817 [Gossypium arboreum]